MRCMKTVALILAAAFAFSGCVLVQADRRGPGVVKLGVDGSKDDRGCRPNEYWDGDSCKHKGKGHGARKHDQD
jgi:hypothetical protein